MIGKTVRDQRPRWSHFPPEGEVPLASLEPRIRAAPAGGQVGRPRSSDPTPPEGEVSLASQTLSEKGVGTQMSEFPKLCRELCRELCRSSSLSTYFPDKACDKACDKAYDKAYDKGRRSRCFRAPYPANPFRTGSSLEPRIRAAHAGGQVGAARPPRPTFP
jgi:hypothetical protein